ncbi:quinoprotein dehydrogenase-associated SoxYZ-like carrier [Burkholderiales bacterium]|nr:quinoprotein dehydrogenase-associated SoxYZ-like carrier [Burkholderiales bacterium]
MLTQLIKTLLLATSLLLTANLNAADPIKLAESEVPEWRTIKTLMFGDRPIRTGKESAISLSINPDIDDASTVPIHIDGLVNQKDQPYIQTLHLIVDQNPIPTAAVFEISPTAGNLHLATRLRIEKFTFVRAVAETSDGQLHMDYKWVAVKGGCSAPSGKNTGSDPLLGKMKVTFNKYRNSYKNKNGEKVFRVPLEQPNVVKVQVRHPNESALAADLDAAVTPNFIQEFTVGFADETVLSAQVNFSLSDNPAFTFSFSPKREGDLFLTVKDTHANTFTRSISVVKADNAKLNK